MYNDSIQNTILDSLDEKVINIVQTNIALLNQGYVVNKAKLIKLDWSSIFIHAFENINVFSTEQQNSIERLYNKLMLL